MNKRSLLKIFAENEKKKDWNLDLSGLGIAQLPREIGGLKHVERLQLGHNKLKSLPNEILKLPKLKTLFLNVEFVLDYLHTQRSLILEWVVIVLIFIEILIFVYEVWFL